MRHIGRVSPLTFVPGRMLLGKIFLSACVAVFGAMLFISCNAAAADPPSWIWAESENGDRVEALVFTQTVRAEGSVRQARLVGGADFCHAVVVVNGKRAASVDAYADWFDLDLTSLIKSGENVVRLEGVAVEGPSALAASVEIVLDDGKTVSWPTGADWSVGEQAGASKVVDYGRVASQMWLPSRPARIDAFDDYTQWRRALRDKSGEAVAESDAATFEIASGYEIRHVLKAAPNQSSWVSLGIQGAVNGDGGKSGLLIGREDEGFLRVRFDDKKRPTISTIPCDQPLKETRGIASQVGAISGNGARWFVNANNSKALYAMDETGGRLRVSKLFDFPGGVGHGRNDLLWTSVPTPGWRGSEFVLGDPTPTLYSIHGDSVDIPTGIVDRTSPNREARQGKVSREGHLLKLQQRESGGGKSWTREMYAGGLRNPFGIAINQDGEKFTYDADAEFDMGAPWYRPTRIVHITAGADYGWRGVTGKWPPYFPDHADNALPLCDVGKGSPTSLHFGYGGDFPAADREALYVLDWAYGRVLRVHMTPRGSGYRARCETFLRGKPLNVTDLAFHGGDMLLVTGGRGTQSNLYRVSYAGEQEKDLEPTRQERRRDAFSRRQRLVRRQLETMHRPMLFNGDVTKQRQVIDRYIWPFLNDADPHLRYAARIALEHQPAVAWQSKALKDDDVVTAITALTALVARQGAPKSQILTRLNELDWAKLPLSEQARLVRCDAMCLAGPVDDRARRAAQQRHLEMYQASVGAAHVDPTGLGRSLGQETLALLLQQDVADATKLASEALRNASTQNDQLFYLFAMRKARKGWTSSQREAFFTSLRETDDYLGGDGMPGFIRQIRQDAVGTLNATEQQQLGSLIAPKSGSNEPPPTPRPEVEQWTVASLTKRLESTAQGDAERGRTVFREALCARCHRMGAEGRMVGPDLTNVRSRFRQADLLKSIIEPSHVIAEKYRQVVVQTQDGKSLTGIATWGGDYRSPTLRLVTNPLLPGEAIELPKKEIRRRRESPVSPMPKGLLNSFEAEQIQDLLAFLLGA